MLCNRYLHPEPLPPLGQGLVPDEPTARVVAIHGPNDGAADVSRARIDETLVGGQSETMQLALRINKADAPYMVGR